MSPTRVELSVTIAMQDGSAIVTKRNVYFHSSILAFSLQMRSEHTEQD